MDRIGDRILQASYLVVPLLLIAVILTAEDWTGAAIGVSAVALVVLTVAWYYMSR